MAWNKPSEDVAGRHINVDATSPSRRWWYFAGVIVVLGAAVAAWWLWPSEEARQDAASMKKTFIKEVAPAVSAINLAPVAVSNAVPLLDGHHEGEFWYDETGKKMITMRRNGKLQHVEVYVPKNRRRPKTHIFDYPSENVIAGLLYAKPGATMIGRPNYSGMTEDFLKSCTAPIIVKADEDEFTQQLKRDVIAAKIELKQRIDAGEDLGKILMDTRKELQKIAQAQRDIERLGVEMLRKEGTSIEDMQIIRESVNKMLEAKGVEPVRFNSIVDFQIRKMQKGEK